MLSEIRKRHVVQDWAAKSMTAGWMFVQFLVRFHVCTCMADSSAQRDRIFVLLPF